MTRSTSNHDEPRTISRAVKCVSLLVGLPLMLHLLLWMTDSSLGGWPAVITTVMAGIGLSITFTADRRVASRPDAEQTLVGLNA